MKSSKTGHSTESHQEATARHRALVDAIAERLGNQVIPPPTQEQIEKLDAEFRNSNRAGRCCHFT